MASAVVGAFWLGDRASTAGYRQNMAHEIMFHDSDPILSRVRSMALALPSAAEKVSHGRPCFFTRKIFLILGATTKGDHHEGRRDQAKNVEIEFNI